MKLLTNSLALLMAFALFSCNEEKNFYGENFNDHSSIGAFPKLLTIASNSFDFTDLENAVYSHSVDFIDGKEGKEVVEYRIYLSYEQPDQDTTSLELFRTIRSQEFSSRPGTNQLGFDLIIPFSEVATFLGINDLSDFSAGDGFYFHTELVRADERVFSSLNSSPAITHAFEGFWDFRVKNSCPLPSDLFVGEYQIEYGYVYDPVNGFGRAFGDSLDRTVLLNPTSDPLERVFNFGFYSGTLTQDVSLYFSCGNLAQTQTRTFIGCGEGVIGAIQNGIATYDLFDDSKFTIEMIDWPPELDGGCSNADGLDLRYSIVFRKI